MRDLHCPLKRSVQYAEIILLFSSVSTLLKAQAILNRMEEGETLATAEMGPSKVLFTLETYCFAAIREYENGTQMG